MEMEQCDTAPVVVLVEPEKGCKREHLEKSKSKSKKYKADDKVPKIDCNHKDAKGGCSAANLTDEDVQEFFTMVYNQNGKYDQDKLLIEYMAVSDPKRIRKRNDASVRSRPVQIQYFVLTKDFTAVKVCAKSFRSITCVSKDRLNRLAKSFISDGKVLEDQRGGMDKARLEKHMEVTESIVHHIHQYRCRESHYGLSKSVRNYLPPELTIRKLWRDWKTQQANMCTYKKFLSVFMTKLNLGIGNPRSDVCPYCEEQNDMYQAATDEAIKNNIMLAKKVHKVRAQAFYQHLRKDPPGTVTVTFNCQQNQPLPKLPVEEVFYNRQVWVYNLTCMVYHGSKETNKEEHITYYIWLETQHVRGPNEVTSALVHYLQHLEDKIPADISEIRLFSDSAASENKNSAVLGAICGYMASSNRWKKIEHFFPVRGHNFMPTDKVFGRVENQLRKQETIVTPEQYYEQFRHHGSVAICEIDWKVKDYETEAETRLKQLLPFQFSEHKVISCVKENDELRVCVRSLYDWGDTFCDILKKGEQWTNYLQSAGDIEPSNKVSVEKAKDVEKLMKYFEVPIDAKDFYDTVLSATASGNDNDAVVYYENEPAE